MGEKPIEGALKLVVLGFIVMVIGSLIVIAGMLLRSWHAGGEMSAAGIVLVGPIPIVWGIGPHSLELILVGLLIVVVVLLALLMMFPRRIVVGQSP